MAGSHRTVSADLLGPSRGSMNRDVWLLVHCRLVSAGLLGPYGGSMNRDVGSMNRDAGSMNRNVGSMNGNVLHAGWLVHIQTS